MNRRTAAPITCGVEFFRWRRKHGGCRTSGDLIFELQRSQFTTSQIKINSIIRFGDWESGGQIKRALRNNMDGPHFPMKCKRIIHVVAALPLRRDGSAIRFACKFVVTMQLPVKPIRTYPMAFGDAMLLLQFLQERRIAL
jgi:hypothetical protein